MVQPNRPNQGRRDHSTKAVVYDPSSHQLAIEDCRSLNREYNSFQVDLPWWRNRVDIYVDPKTKTGLVATVQLNRLGKIKNWQRHIGHNYTVLHVKGLKPDTPSRTSSSSNESMPGGNEKMSRPLSGVTNT